MRVFKKIHQMIKKHDLGGITKRFCPGANLNYGPQEKNTLLIHGMTFLLNFFPGAILLHCSQDKILRVFN